MTMQLILKAKYFTICVISVMLAQQSSYAQNHEQWYADAQSRIDTLRRGNFTIEVYDHEGQPFSGQVRVRMKKHEFPFGMAFDFYEGDIETDVPTETEWMKAAMYKYFNYGVSGNSFKWSGIDPRGNGPDYTNFDYAVEWTQNVGWDLRAHTLLWGGAEGDNHAMPQWVTNLGSADAVFAKCEERIKREVTKYKGIIKEYDVMNEPLHATYTQELYGDSLNWKCFQWAHEADPDAELYINEYNVEYGWGDVEEYVALINTILDKGAPVTGIGIQAHFWDCCRPDVHDLVTQINKIATVGLPIRLTEYDFGGNLTEAQQAEDFIKVATIAFSHPAINGMISWGLSDLGAWREGTGYFHADHRPKLAADTLLYYTQELWATNLDEFTGNDGNLNFDAYYGDYRIEVFYDDGWKEFNVSCRKEDENIAIQLHANEGFEKSLELIAARLSALDVLELTFDQAIDASSLNSANFRVFAQSGVVIERISLKDNDDQTIVLNLDKQLSVLDHATVSYFPGILTAATGASALAFGIEKINIDGNLNKEPVVTDHQFTLRSDAVSGSVVGTVLASDPEGGELEFKIIEGNHMAIFGINGSGELILVNPLHLDVKAMPIHELSVQVSDGVHQVIVKVIVTFDEALDTNQSFSDNYQVFPNPSLGNFTIQGSTPFDGVFIYDLGGKLLQSFNHDNSASRFSIQTNLTEGVYLLKVKGRNGTHTSKVVINNRYQGL